MAKNGRPPLDPSGSEAVTVRLSRSVLDQINAAAAAAEIDRSAWLRFAVDLALDQRHSVVGRAKVPS